MHSDQDVIILCGGLGIRLRPVVGEQQKALAEVSGKPFLGILIDSLAVAGFKRFILATGYQKEAVREYINQIYTDQTKLSFIFSEEDEPLGTGGAVKLALAQVKSEHVLVLNGDSFCDLDLINFFAAHTMAGAVLTLALLQSDRIDGGRVQVDHRGKVLGFLKKKTFQNLTISTQECTGCKKKLQSICRLQVSFLLRLTYFQKLSLRDHATVIRQQKECSTSVRRNGIKLHQIF